MRRSDWPIYFNCSNTGSNEYWQRKTRVEKLFLLLLLFYFVLLNIVILFYIFVDRKV